MPPRRYRSRSRSRNFSDSEQSSVCQSEHSRRSRSRSISSDNSEYRLHIADIAEGVKKSDIYKVFNEYGGLKEIWMANSPPCFGFAVFKNKSNAIAALKGSDGLMLGGCRIRVTHARPRTRGQGRRFYNPNMRCYECGLQGHFYRDCPELCDKDYGSKYSRRTPYNHHGNNRKRNYTRNERRYSEDRSPEERRRRR